jgi:hypothetical protein
MPRTGVRYTRIGPPPRSSQGWLDHAIRDLEQAVPKVVQQLLAADALPRITVGEETVGRHAQCYPGSDEVCRRCSLVLAEALLPTRVMSR